MSHCIRCGHELPSAGAECPECRIAFHDVLEDSSFLADDDDEAEGFEPAPRTSRVSRWDKYLDESPVFAGQDDDPPAREPFLRDRSPAPQPVTPPQLVSTPQPEPVAELTPTTEPEPVADPDPVAAPIAAVEPAAPEQLGPALPEDPLVDIAPAHEPQPATSGAPHDEEEPETGPIAAAESPILEPMPVAEPVVLAPVAEAPPSEEIASEENEHTESVTGPVNVVVVLPVKEDEESEVEEEAEAPSFAAPWRRPDADLSESADDEPQVEEIAMDEPIATESPAVREPVEEPIAQPVMTPVLEPMTVPVAVPVLAPVAEVVAPPLQVDVHTGPVNVKIVPRFEFHSAPANGSPVVHAMLDLEPSGAPLVTGSDGPMAHVVLALDLSASMNDPRKYPVLTRAIEGMITDLRDSNEGEVLVSLVVFAYGSETLLRAQPASQLDPREVLSLIDGSPLRFSRYTDLAGALSRAGRIAYDGHRAMPRVPVRVYVLTDGKPQDIKLARHKANVLRKVPADVHGLAFGDDADLETLQELICGGRGGTVKHVRSDTLSSAFERIAQVARRVVAKRALLDIELKGGVVGGASYRFRPARHTYGKHAFANGQMFHTDLGTIESGRRYSLLFQLRLPPTQQDETEIGRVTLRIPGEGGPVTFEHLLFITRHAGDELPSPDDIVVEARHVVEAVGAADPEAQLKALKARRRLYVEERRDPYIIELIDRAISQMETKGSLDALSNGERAALQSHTQSVVGMGA